MTPRGWDGWSGSRYCICLYTFVDGHNHQVPARQKGQCTVHFTISLT